MATCVTTQSELKLSLSYGDPRHYGQLFATIKLAVFFQSGNVFKDQMSNAMDIENGTDQTYDDKDCVYFRIKLYVARFHP